MTGAPAPVLSAQSTLFEPGLALYVGMTGTDGPAGRALLADVAQAVAAVIDELAPGATTYSAMTLGGRHDDVVARVREELAPASTRSRVARRTLPRRPEVIVDAVAREVIVGGRPVSFTRKEFALLEYLLRAPHRAVTREELLANVWRKGTRKDTTRTIDVHVRRLREKLGGSPRIVTIRGVGYRCDPTPEVVLVGSGDAD
jgi:DNA-binding winged helix-turn-helix (wHTH) protein